VGSATGVYAVVTRKASSPNRNEQTSSPQPSLLY